MMWALNKKHAIKEKRKRYKSTRIQEIKGIAYRPSNHIKDTVKSVQYLLRDGEGEQKLLA